MLRRAVIAGLALAGAPFPIAPLSAQPPTPAATAPVAPKAVPVGLPAASPRMPLPAARGPLALGKDVFAILRGCQDAGWRFFPRDGEDVKNRRGVRYVLTAANVLPPDTDPASRYRLTFLDGRLVGLRTEWRAADPQRVESAKSAHGAPAWEAPASGEWVAPDKGIAFAVWRDGTREELVSLGHLRARGFYTDAEISQELRRRKDAGQGASKKLAPAPSSPASGSSATAK